MLSWMLLLPLILHFGFSDSDGIIFISIPQFISWLFVLYFLEDGSDEEFVFNIGIIFLIYSIC